MLNLLRRKKVEQPSLQSQGDAFAAQLIEPGYQVYRSVDSTSTSGALAMLAITEGRDNPVPLFGLELTEEQVRQMICLLLETLP